MFARALLVLLVVLNLGVAAWWRLHEPAAGAAVDALPGNVPRLQLASERRNVASNVAPAPAPATQAPVDAAPAADAVCASLGPYPDAAAAAAAQTRIEAQVLRSRVGERSVGRARGWRVLVPALPSAAEAEALAARIAMAGFSDYFVMREGRDANAVALGRFQSERAARRHAEAVAAAGFPAVRVEAIGVAPQAWLDVALAAGSDPAVAQAAAGAAQTRPLDCAALR
jgi:hypothetical protein